MTTVSRIQQGMFVYVGNLNKGRYANDLPLASGGFFVGGVGLWYVIICNLRSRDSPSLKTHQ